MLLAVRTCVIVQFITTIICNIWNETIALCHNVIDRGPRWHSGSVAVLQIGRSQVRFHTVSLEYFIETIFPMHYGFGVGSASN